jgi:hypothetical protein
MSSLPFKVIAAALVAAFAFASPADAAKKHKSKKAASVSTSTERGTNLFPAGPLYFSGVYLGDDPDPNIRFQLWRDISGRFGGDSN